MFLFPRKLIMTFLEQFTEKVIVCCWFWVTSYVDISSNHQNLRYKFLTLILYIFLSLVGDEQFKANQANYIILKFRRFASVGLIYIVTALPSVAVLTKSFGNDFMNNKLWDILLSSTLSIILLAIYLCYSTKAVVFTLLMTIAVHLILPVQHFQWSSALIGASVVIIFFILVKICPSTFSFCEASLLSQCILFLIINQALHWQSWYYDVLPNNMHDVVNFILTLFTSTLLIIVLLSPILYCERHFIDNQGRWIFSIVFYIGAILCLFVVFFPLAYINVGRNPLLWMMDILFLNHTRKVLILYWTILVTISGIVVYWYFSNSNHSRIPKTIVRKIFHIIAVFIYLPAPLEHQFMSFISALVLVVFLVLEVIRIFRVKPFGDFLDIYFQPFRDEKDAGILILTHIYLLFGLSFPFWMNSSDSVNPFHLLSTYSGVISLGIGDTCAAVFGKLYGQRKWPNGEKTYLGTFSCFISQLIFMLCILWCATNTNVTFVIVFILACVSFSTSVLESVSTQIDNVILPIYTFIFLNVTANFIS